MNEPDTKTCEQWHNDTVEHIHELLALDAQRFGRRQTPTLEVSIVAEVAALAARLTEEAESWQQLSIEMQHEKRELQERARELAEQRDNLLGRHAQWVCLQPRCEKRGVVQSIAVKPATHREIVMHLCSACHEFMEPTSGHKRTLQHTASTAMGTAQSALDAASAALRDAADLLKTFETQP